MRFMLKESYAEKRYTKLSVKDKKLIQLLIQDSRATISELAKKVGISKSAIVQKIKSLTKKGILLDPIVYTNVNLSINEKTYSYHIKTQLGMNKEEVNNKLLSIKGLTAILWYNGAFDIILTSVDAEPQDIIEEIEKIIPIKKLRIQKVIGNWFHPPHLFNEIKDVSIKLNRNTSELTKLDEKILLYLHEKPKASLVDIAENIKSSPITIKKRIIQLKKNNSIISFSNYINFWKVNKDLISVSFIVKGNNNTDNLIKKILKIPQAGNIWEFDHEWNINTVFWVENQYEINKILESINKDCNGILDVEIMAMAGMVGK